MFTKVVSNFDLCFLNLEFSRFSLILHGSTFETSSYVIETAMLAPFDLKTKQDGIQWTKWPLRQDLVDKG